MQKLSLTAQARELLKTAQAASSGRGAKTVYGGHEHALSQTVIALSAGRTLHDHDSNGEATLYVLHGRVSLSAPPLTWEAMTGDLIIVPERRHSLRAIEDSALLLTVVKWTTQRAGSRSQDPRFDRSTRDDLGSLVSNGAARYGVEDGWVSP